MPFARSITTTLCVASAQSLGLAADPAAQPCCKAPTLECLACAFCERNPDSRICGWRTTSTIPPPIRPTSTAGPTRPTSTAGPTPSGSCTANITSNADCNSADITNVTGSSTHECCAACSATEGCGAFVLVHGGEYDHTCFLKTHCELKPGSCAGSTCTAGTVTRPPIADYPDGGRSEEMLPDSMLWELFNASDEVLKKQAAHEMQAKPCCRAPTLGCLACAFCERNPDSRICRRTTTSTAGPTRPTSTAGPNRPTSTAGPTPSGSCTANITSNADCNSADITNVTGRSTHECCAACSATEGCGAFVLVHGGQYDHTCFLKTHCELKPGSCAGSTCTAGTVTSLPVANYPDVEIIV